MIALIGQPGLSVSMLFVVVFLAGFGILRRSGRQQRGGGDLLSDRCCDRPASARRSASAASDRSSGRHVAEFMRPRYSTHQLFLVFAVPALLSAVAVASLRVVMRPATVANAAKASDHPVSERLAPGASRSGINCSSSDVREATSPHVSHVGRPFQDRASSRQANLKASLPSDDGVDRRATTRVDQTLVDDHGRHQRIGDRDPSPRPPSATLEHRAFEHVVALSSA